MPINKPMRRLVALLLLLAGAISSPAQWQIFAEKLPKPGTWARYRYETIREGKVVSKSELSLSIRAGMDVGGKPHVWFNVEPVGWLGSRERAPLRLLLSAERCQPLGGGQAEKRRGIGCRIDHHLQRLRVVGRQVGHG